MRTGETVALEVSDLGERWRDDPSVLDSFLSRARVEGLKASGNELRMIVTACTFNIWHDGDPGRRRKFRDAAVSLPELGRCQGILRGDILYGAGHACPYVISA